MKGDNRENREFWQAVSQVYRFDRRIRGGTFVMAIQAFQVPVPVNDIDWKVGVVERLLWLIFELNKNWHFSRLVFLFLIELSNVWMMHVWPLCIQWNAMNKYADTFVSIGNSFHFYISMHWHHFHHSILEFVLKVILWHLWSWIKYRSRSYIYSYSELMNEKIA